VSVRNDCRTFESTSWMDDKNKKPRRVLQMQQSYTKRSHSGVTRVTHNMQACHTSDRRRRLLFQDTPHCDQPLRDIRSSSSTTKHCWSTAGALLVKACEAANLMAIAERSGSQFRASMACRCQAMVRSKLAYSKAGEMSRF
jgi:hypothetical protein